MTGRNSGKSREEGYGCSQILRFSQDSAWKLLAPSALRQHGSHQGLLAAAVSPHPTPIQRLLQQQDNASLNIFQHLHSSSQPSKATEPPCPWNETCLRSLPRQIILGSHEDAKGRRLCLSTRAHPAQGPLSGSRSGKIPWERGKSHNKATLPSWRDPSTPVPALNPCWERELVTSGNWS